MVDPQSWVRFSDERGEYEGRRHRCSSNFRQYEYDYFLGCGCECTICDQKVATVDPILPIKDFWYEGRDSDEILNDEFYLLCSPIVRGYALNERKWGTYNTDNPSSLSIVTDFHS
jgi:hypothetical protein